MKFIQKNDQERKYQSTDKISVKERDWVDRQKRPSRLYLNRRKGLKSIT